MANQGPSEVIKQVFPCSEVVTDVMYPTWLALTDLHVLKARFFRVGSSNRLA